MLFLDEAECGGAGRGGESPGVEDVVDEVDAFVGGTFWEMRRSLVIRRCR